MGLKGVQSAREKPKVDWFIECKYQKYRKLLHKVETSKTTFSEFLSRVQWLFPKFSQSMMKSVQRKLNSLTQQGFPTPQRNFTRGINKNGTFYHTYGEEFMLVPLRNWNWKWGQSRVKYSNYEKELMAGVVILGQRRFIEGNPIFWFCDQSAVEHFLTNMPSRKPRLKRCWVFLNQMS